MSKPYSVYVNGILAKRHMTLHFAVKTANRFMGAYVVDERQGKVVWQGL